MKTSRPVTIIIAAILLAVLSLSNFPTRIPGAVTGNRGNRAFNPNNNGDTTGGNQNFQNNNGGLPSTGGNGNDFGNGGSSNGNNFGNGGFGNGAGGNFNPNGNRFRQQSTILGIRSGVLLQLGLLALNLIFLVLGLVAALGLFQLKRWGMVLGLIVVAYNLIMAGRSIYNYASFASLRASGAFANFGGGAAGAFTGFRLAFPYLAIAQIVVAIVVAVLALLPMSRKAIVSAQPAITTVA